MSKDEKNNNLQMQIYIDLSNTLRHYGNLQFAQLTVFIAIAAGIFTHLNGSSQQKQTCFRIPLEFGAAVLGVLFLLI